jgi:hypothetical protein
MIKHVKSHHNSTLIKREFHRFHWQRILKLAMAADALRVKGFRSQSIGMMTKCVKCILDAEKRKQRREELNHVRQRDRKTDTA